jgi:BNR repeat-containing family member/FG-GAP-like repeat
VRRAIGGHAERGRASAVALGGAMLLGIAVAVPAGAQEPGGPDAPPTTAVPHVAPGEPLPPTRAPPVGPPPAEPGPEAAAAAATLAATPTTPGGTTTLLDSGAWSWFEDERVVIDAAGRRLYASAVEAWPTAGNVVLAQVDMASGARRNLSLGVGELDDHNSAAIWEAPNREVLTAWSRHSADPIIRTHRRRTDGSWLRLPPVVDSWPFVTYNNLYSALAADGLPVLYDFYRGSRIDPQAMASLDAGRTWSRLGAVLRDPTDSTGQRPYVRYASRGDRIDLIATETHPRNSRTSVYHGFIRDGILHTSDGRSLGRVGTGVPVTSLTLVATPGVAEAAWTVDVNYDPATGRPIAAYSTTLSPTDHRYHVARWTGTAWDAREVAFAGRGLYPAEYHYTGLVALDPRDGGHVVISTDADPVTGRSLVSGTDGRRHWELFDGRRQADGRYAWTPLTANSRLDNIRPVMAGGPGPSSALAWMRGTYTTYSSYAMAVVGVVRRADGSTVATGAAGTPLPVVLGIAAPAVSSVEGVPLSGDFDAHPADDLMLYRSGSGREDLVIGDDGGRPVFASARAVNGQGYLPVTGDFDADGDEDVLWHGPGARTDSLWLATPDAGWRPTTAPQVTSRVHRPLAGDFDADGDDDVLWYSANGGETLWRADRGTFTSVAAPQVRSAYRTAVGDIDRDGDDDILWHGPGTAADWQWLAQDGRFPQQFRLPDIDGDVQPLAGDYDGDGDDDVLLYAPGTAIDQLWVAEAGRYTPQVSPRQAGGTYRPSVLDLDGNRADDILWYRVGGLDYLWSSSAGSPFARSATSPVAL